LKLLQIIYSKLSSKKKDFIDNETMENFLDFVIICKFSESSIQKDNLNYLRILIEKFYINFIKIHSIIYCTINFNQLIT
jgi:hypothetical protein